MENTEFIRSEAFKVAEVIEYLPNSVVIKSIIKRLTGNVSAVSFDSGELLSPKSLPFETFIQIIEGNAEVVIDDKSNLLEMGQSIIIPANSRNTIKANKKFKMLSTLIKSGYEEVS
ncbi:MAG: cupin domain-containing protein [Bacteroidales bacterium]|nr:cupin domain-containing protein [Bacteroidales bacterium]